MLGQHIRRGHEFRGGAVPLQTGLDELGQLVAGERVQLAAGAVVVGLAVTRLVPVSPVNHSRASSSSSRSAGSSFLRVNFSVSRLVLDGLRHRQTQVDDLDVVVGHAGGRLTEGAGDVVPVDVGVVQDEYLHVAELGARQQIPARGRPRSPSRR